MTSSSRRVTAVLAILACALAASLASAAAATAAGAPAGIRPAPAAPGAAAPASAVSAQSPSLVYAYPSSFDLRDKGKVSPVKDQSPYGTCWAFAALGSLESNLLPGETWDFSEDNLLWYSGFDNAGYDGGNSLMATAYLDPLVGTVHRGTGRVLQGRRRRPSRAVDPGRAEARPGRRLPARPHLARGQRRHQVRAHELGRRLPLVVLQGSLALLDFRAPTPTTTTARGLPNHGVLVVGWDDKYPRRTSSTRVGDRTKPAGDGAFLVKNS